MSLRNLFTGNYTTILPKIIYWAINRFRSLHSAAVALSKSADHWLMNIGNGKMNSVVFLDIKKAFDAVNHEMLLLKLSCYVIKDLELMFFQSYLYNRTQSCNINGKISSYNPATCGVPQGSILGPLLFILYMNHLSFAVDNAETTIYADDTSMYRAFNNINSLTDELIPAFGKICEWLKSNKLALNSLKTEFMIIGRSHGLNNLDSLPESTPYLISIESSYIRRVKQVKYLELIVDDKLKWEEHMYIEYISSKIIPNIGVLKRTRAFIPQHSLQTLYRTMIEPYLRYCNIVWGQRNKTLLGKLQTLQNKAARTIASLRYEDVNH